MAKADASRRRAEAQRAVLTKRPERPQKEEEEQQQQQERKQRALLQNTLRQQQAPARRVVAAASDTVVVPSTTTTEQGSDDPLPRLDVVASDVVPRENHPVEMESSKATTYTVEEPMVQQPDEESFLQEEDAGLGRPQTEPSDTVKVVLADTIPHDEPVAYRLQDDETRQRLVEETARMQRELHAEAQRLADEKRRLEAEQERHAATLAEDMARIKAQQEWAARTLAEKAAKIKAEQEQEARILAEKAAQLKAEQEEAEAAVRRLADEQETRRIAAEKAEQQQMKEILEAEAQRQAEEAVATEAALATIKELQDRLKHQKEEAERARQEAIRAEKARAELEKQQLKEIEKREQERLELESTELEQRSQELMRMEKDYAELAAQRARVEELYLEEAKLRMAVEEKYRMEQEAREKAVQIAKLNAQAALLKAEQDAEAIRLAEEKARIAADAEKVARIQAAEKDARLQAEREAEAKEAALATIKELRDMLDAQRREAELAKQQAIRAEEARAELEKVQQAEIEKREQERLELETAELERRSQELARMENDYAELAAQRAQVEEMYQKEAKLRVAAEEKHRIEQEARKKAMEIASLNAQEVEKARMEAEEIRKAVQREAQMREIAEALRKQEELARVSLEEAQHRLEEQATVAEEKRRLELEARKKAEALVEEKAKELSDLRTFEERLRAEADAARAEAENARQLAETEAARRDLDVASFKEEQLRLHAQAVAAKREMEAMKQLADAEAALRAREIESLRNEISQMIAEERKRVTEETRLALETALKSNVEAAEINKKNERFQRALIAQTYANDIRARGIRVEKLRSIEDIQQQQVDREQMLPDETAKVEADVDGRGLAGLYVLDRIVANEIAAVEEQSRTTVEGKFPRKGKKKSKKSKLEKIVDGKATEETIRLEADEVSELQTGPSQDTGLECKEKDTIKSKQELFQRSLLAAKLRNDAVAVKVTLNLERVELVGDAEGNAYLEAEETATRLQTHSDGISCLESEEEQAVRKSKQELFQRSLLSAKLQNDAVAVVIALDREIADLEKQIRFEKEREIIRLEAELMARQNGGFSNRMKEREDIAREQRRKDNLVAQRNSDKTTFRDSMLDSMKEVDAMSRKRVRKSLDEVVTTQAQSVLKQYGLVQVPSVVQPRRSPVLANADAVSASIADAESQSKRSSGVAIDNEFPSEGLTLGDFSDRTDSVTSDINSLFPFLPSEIEDKEAKDMITDGDDLVVSRGKKIRLAPPEAVSQYAQEVNELQETAPEVAEKYMEDKWNIGRMSEVAKNDDIVSRVLSLDFKEDEFAELSLILNLGGSGTDGIQVAKVSLSIVEILDFCHSTDSKARHRNRW